MRNFALSLMLLIGIALYTDSCRQSKSHVLTTNVTPTPVASVPLLTDDVEIDFESCVPRRSKIDVTFGSTTFEIVGRTENGCLMKYGGEVENPDWDGFLDKACIIPFKLGTQRFKKTSIEVNFSSLESYCTSNPRR
jgi:hypothetical protein